MPLCGACTTVHGDLVPPPPPLPGTACVPFPSRRIIPRRLVSDERAGEADLWLINSCTVKSPSQSAMDSLIRRGKAAGKALVVAGCVPQVCARVRQQQLLPDATRRARSRSCCRAPAGPAAPRPSLPRPAPQGDRRASELRGLSLLGVSQIGRVVEVVESTLNGQTVQLLARAALPQLDLPKAR